MRGYAPRGNALRVIDLIETQPGFIGDNNEGGGGDNRRYKMYMQSYGQTVTTNIPAQPIYRPDALPASGL